MREVPGGTRYLTDLWLGGARSRRSRPRGRRVVGRCGICGREVLWGESYHATGCRLVHMVCEFREWQEREVAS